MDGRMDGWMDRRAGGQATLHETFFLLLVSWLAEKTSRVKSIPIVFIRFLILVSQSGYRWWG